MPRWKREDGVCLSEPAKSRCATKRCRAWLTFSLVIFSLFVSFFFFLVCPFFCFSSRSFSLLWPGRCRSILGGLDGECLVLACDMAQACDRSFGGLVTSVAPATRRRVARLPRAPPGSLLELTAEAFALC